MTQTEIKTPEQIEKRINYLKNFLVPWSEDSNITAKRQAYIEALEWVLGVGE